MLPAAEGCEGVSDLSPQFGSGSAVVPASFPGSEEEVDHSLFRSPWTWDCRLHWCTLRSEFLLLPAMSWQVLALCLVEDQSFISEV
jgi:hypothetical protein